MRRGQRGTRSSGEHGTRLERGGRSGHGDGSGIAERHLLREIGRDGVGGIRSRPRSGRLGLLEEGIEQKRRDWCTDWGKSVP